MSALPPSQPSTSSAAPTSSSSLIDNFEIDIEAIRRRNNDIIKAQDYYLPSEHFNSECDNITLSPEEKQFFDRRRNQQIMASERRKLAIESRTKAKRSEAYELEQDEQLNSDSRFFDVKRSRTLAIGRDRMNEKYANQIESTDMDDSSIICSLCQQFILARDFYKHVDKNHHDYVSKLETMNRQLFRNAGPVELDFPPGAEFDTETHSIGQIDHLAIDYCRAEHISTNSLLIHDFRPTDSRRRLCLVHRMNEFLEKEKEKEKTRKKQAQAKEDKKLLTQENKKRKKNGLTLLTELPPTSSTYREPIPRRHYHHRGRTGLVSLTPLQILALKNRDYLHQNPDFQPKIRSLDFSSASELPPESPEVLELSAGSSAGKEKHPKKFDLLNFMRQHNSSISQTVIPPTTQSQSRLSARDDDNLNTKDGYLDSDMDSDYAETKNPSSMKHEFEDILFEKMIPSKGFKDDCSELESDKKTGQSPAVRLMNSCSHVQNRHLRRPKGDYIAKKLYKSRSVEPYFAYERWNVRKNILLQRVDWSSAAIGKYFPTFKSNDRFMRYLSAKVIEFRDVPISRCVKNAILEAIADRKFFLNADALKDISKAGQLRKVFRKLSRAEQKYEKYSKNGERFQDFLDSDSDKKTNGDEEKSKNCDKKAADKFFDSDGIFFNENVNISSLPLPFPFSNQTVQKEPQNCRDDESKAPGKESGQQSIQMIMKKLTSVLFSRNGNAIEAFQSAISIEEYPLIYRELSNLSSERLVMDSSIQYPSLDSALNRHFKNGLSPEEGGNEGEEEVYELNDKAILSDEEFSVTHADYIGKILRLFDIHPEECDAYSDHDYLSYDMLEHDIQQQPHNQQSQHHEEVKVQPDMANSSKDIAPVQGNVELWNGTHNGETDGVTKRFIPQSSNSKVTLFPPQSFVANGLSKVVQAPAGNKRYFILKNGNQVAGIFQPGTVLLMPQSSAGSIIDGQHLQQGIGILPAQYALNRKLGKADHELFKGPEPPNGVSAHKYFTRSSDNVRKRPSSESSNGSASGSVKKTKPLMGSKSPCGGTIDNMNAVSGSPAGRCLSPAYNYNFIANKSPLREISQGDNRLNGSVDKQEMPMDSKEEFTIEQSPRRDVVYDQISESYVLAVNMTEGGNGFVEKQVPKSELVKG